MITPSDAELTELRLICERFTCEDDVGYVTGANMRRLAEALAALTAERAARSALQRHYDAAAPEHNLLALLDLYEERESAALEAARAAEERGRMAALQKLEARFDLRLAGARLTQNHPEYIRAMALALEWTRDALAGGAAKAGE